MLDSINEREVTAHYPNKWRVFFAGTATGVAAVVWLVTNEKIRNKLIEIAKKEYIHYKWKQFKQTVTHGFQSVFGKLRNTHIGQAVSKQGSNLGNNLAGGASNIKHGLSRLSEQVSHRRSN